MSNEADILSVNFKIRPVQYSLWKEVKKMKNKILIPVAAFMIAGTVYFGAIATQAQTANTTDPHTSIIQKISQRFGLKENDVKVVFDEERTERQAQMQARYEKQLNQYVTEGMITEAQKQLIIAKHKEMQNERITQKETMQNLTPEERKAQMETKRQEMESWAKTNGIDPQYLGMFGHKGFGMMKRFNQ